MTAGAAGLQQAEYRTLSILDAYRQVRVLARQLAMTEPYVPVTCRLPLEFHGNDYCGWAIPQRSISGESVVVDVGLGEDVSFSRSLIDRYGCKVHGFDPTPRAISYVKSLGEKSLVLHEYGVAAQSGPAVFYLPNKEGHVSGSLVMGTHVGQTRIEVQLVTVADMFRMIGCSRITLLKLDIEGAEYELIASESFREYASRIDMICIEFHHRWNATGRKRTLDAVATLAALGFACAWRSRSTNEEFLFVNKQAVAGWMDRK